jgi:hypothetical protein
VTLERLGIVEGVLDRRIVPVRRQQPPRDLD